MNLSHTLVVFDLETTGTWVEKDKIIEIGMIKMHPDGTKEAYAKRVNPSMPIPKCISELTGITDSDVADAPVFKDIAQEVLEFIGTSDIGGFNVERFDLPLLQREMRDNGLKFEWKMLRVYDAQKVYHLNEKRNLTAAFKFYCNKNLGENAHSALADSEATLEILSAQADRYTDSNSGLEPLRAFDYKKTSNFYDEEGKFRWWNGKLYMMFGKYAKKCCLQEITKRDRKYLEWIISANFSEEIKMLCENALNGKFPLFEANEQGNLFS